MQTLDKNKMREIPPGNTVTQIKDFRDSSSRKPYPVHYPIIQPGHFVRTVPYIL